MGIIEKGLENKREIIKPLYKSMIPIGRLSVLVARVEKECGRKGKGTEKRIKHTDG